MDRNLKISGDNPFYISFRDARLDGDPDLVPPEAQQLVVYQWRIARHPCLSAEVVPVRDSAIELRTRQLPGDYPQPGQGFEVRRIPQTLKVTLSCNDCPCGERSLTIRYLRSSRGSEAAGYSMHEISVSIICVTPECEAEEEVIRRVSLESSEHLYDISLPDQSQER